MTFLEHLEELRKRLFFSVISISIGSLFGAYLSKDILDFLIRPLQQSVYYTSPAGGFDLIFRSSVLFGVFLSMPILAYNLLRFIGPAISHMTERKIAIFIFFSWFSSLLGVSFAYYYSLPAALHFLNGFGSENIKALIATGDYFSFISLYLIGFSVFFQLPLVMLVINSIKPLQPKKLLGYIKYVILVSFVLAAIITPTPDAINLAIMALPPIMLYVLSIGIIAAVSLNKVKAHPQVEVATIVDAN